MSTQNVTTSVQQLYGLKVGDSVQYIGDETRHVKDIIYKIGPIVEIEPRGGQFYVKFNDIAYNVSFARQDLLLLENKQQEEIDFNGILVDREDLTIDEMRSYLLKYHGFTEGLDFAVTLREINNETYKEVFLTHPSYVKLMKDLFSFQKAREVLTGENVKDFKNTFRTTILEGSAISASFKISSWTFRTHVLGWHVQKYLAMVFGVDLMYELGLENTN
ncbi:hypothetical protein D3C81_1327590 [compost metagenome]